MSSLREDEQAARGSSAVGSASAPAGSAAAGGAPRPGDPLPSVPPAVKAAVAAVLKRPAASTTAEVPPWKANKERASADDAEIELPEDQTLPGRLLTAKLNTEGGSTEAKEARRKETCISAKEALQAAKPWEKFKKPVVPPWRKEKPEGGSDEPEPKAPKLMQSKEKAKAPVL